MDASVCGSLGAVIILYLYEPLHLPAHKKRPQFICFVSKTIFGELHGTLGLDIILNIH